MFLSDLVYGDKGTVLINHVYVLVPMTLYTFVPSETIPETAHTPSSLTLQILLSSEISVVYKLLFL